MYQASITNLDTNGLFYNPYSSKEDLSEAQWHRNFDGKVVLRQHANTYLTLMSSSATMVLYQNLDEKFDKNQVISNKYKDLAILYKFQYRTFLLYISKLRKR